MDNNISRYISRHEPAGNEELKKVKLRVKEIIDRVEIRGHEAVKLDQTQEDFYKEIGHAFVKAREVEENGTIHETERHVKFTRTEEGLNKTGVHYLIDVDKHLSTEDGKVIDGIGYTKAKYSYELFGDSLSQEKILYGISECNSAATKHFKEEVEVSVKGPGVKYSIKDMNDPNFKEETYLLSKDDIGLA
jgi:hypothetical protein